MKKSVTITIELPAIDAYLARYASGRMDIGEDDIEAFRQEMIEKGVTPDDIREHAKSCLPTYDDSMQTFVFILTQIHKGVI